MQPGSCKRKSPRLAPLTRSTSDQAFSICASSCHSGPTISTQSLRGANRCPLLSCLGKEFFSKTMLFSLASFRSNVTLCQHWQEAQRLVFINCTSTSRHKRYLVAPSNTVLDPVLPCSYTISMRHSTRIRQWTKPSRTVRTTRQRQSYYRRPTWSPGVYKLPDCQVSVTHATRPHPSML